MKPFINLEENIGKTVGKRTGILDPLAYGLSLQKAGNDLQAAFGFGGLCPKGVFRFKTHEEADAWTMKMLVERANKRS